MRRTFIILISSLLLLLSCKNEENKNTPPHEQKVKKVILIIGDGMGVSQVSSTLFFGSQKPAFLRFTTTGLHIPSSAKQKITDSAAGATAFATGVKTYNGAISKDTLKKNTETLLERISDKDVATGLIATSSITHATPACFYAHVDERHSQDSIASQLVNANLDFFAGGGLQFFNMELNGTNTFSQLEKIFIIDTTALGKKSELNSNKKYGYLLEKDGLRSAEDGRGDFLTEASLLAIDYLNNKGTSSFLMIEGSQIDWAGHAANQNGLIEEMKDFNKTLNAVLDFAEKDGETLVIVTADHETGGFTLAPKWEGIKWNYDKIEGKFYDGISDGKSAIGHTGTMVPVFTYGPRSEIFTGVYENTEIFHKIMEVTGW